MANIKAKKRRKLVVLLLIVAVLGGLGALAVFKKREAAITVQTEKVERRTLTELVVANGRIQPVFQVKISPEVSGEIIELPVKEGDQVKKGDLLLKIKPDLYVAQRNSSEANYKGALAGRLTAEANVKKAEIDLQRAEALHESKLLPDAEFLAVQTTCEINKAQLQHAIHQVEMAKAALEKADEDLSKTTIVSPLDGTVSRLNSQLGERVVGTAMMAGTEVMVIADLNEMEARVDIGEIDVVLIQLGQNARLEVDAYKDRKFNGTVTEIANSSKGLVFGSGGGSQSTDATKFEVKIRIKEKEPFRPGMTVTAEIETRSRTNVLSVPIASVTTRIPKPPGQGKRPAKGAQAATAAKDAGAPTNSTAQTGTNTPAPQTAQATHAAPGTNDTAATASKKPGDKPKHVEVVFLKENDRARMVPVKIGISDDAYTEILEGVADGQEVISGSYKALRSELDEGKKVRIGALTPDKDKDKATETR